MSDETTVSELGRSLHDCADYLRGSVDGGEFKDYILPLVFYSEANRRFSEEYEEILEDAGFERDADDSDLDEAIREIASDEVAQGIQIPEGYSWEAITNRDEGYATFIDEALRAFEECNGQYEGIFETRYSNTRSLTGDDGDATLESVVEAIDKEVYQSDSSITYDMIGEAFMYLVKQFATEEGGEYFTPTRVVRLVVELIEPFDPEASIHDPTSGSGGMLVEASNEIHRRWKNGLYEDNYDDVIETDSFRNFLRSNGYTFTGQEKNPKIAGMGQMNLALHNLDGEIRHGDSLTSPQFTVDSELQKFDYILANFPFSVTNWKSETKDRASSYGDMDWADKLPHGNRGDFSFIMHMHSHLAEDGRLATVIPHGVLFRNSDQPFREYMIENDLIEAIVGLPKNLFESTSIPAAILVLNNDKPSHRENEIMFFNADHEGRFYRNTGNDRNLLIDPIADNPVSENPGKPPIYSEMENPEGTAEIKQLFDEWTSEERVCRVVSTDDIRENDYNLNIALYVDTTEPQEDISVEDTLADIHNLETEYESLHDQLTTYMTQLNYEGDTDD